MPAHERYNHVRDIESAVLGEGSACIGSGFEHSLGNLARELKGDDIVPSWSRDDRIYFGSARLAGTEIFRMRPDGSAAQQVTHNGGFDRINALFVQGKAKPGLSIIEARRILWMYTSRDIYRMLVQDAAWTPDHYERWLSLTLVAALVNPAAPELEAYLEPGML